MQEAEIFAEGIVVCAGGEENFLVKYGPKAPAFA